jgi:phage shock protein A
MAGLMSRTSLIVKSKFSKLLNRAENPNETLDYSYEQMQTQLQNVKRGVADVVTAKKRLELQTQKLEQNVVKLDTQARQALAANREDLAREALERKAAAQLQLQGLDEQVKQLQDQQEKLVAGQQTLETRIEGFRSTKEVLKAQYSAAEAQVKIGEAATGIGRGMEDTGAAIQRAKDKTEELQARASAIDELTTSGALEDYTAGGQTALDRELAQISTTSQVDSDLARLKAEVGAGDASKELGAGEDPANTGEEPAKQWAWVSPTSSSDARSSRNRRATGSSRSPRPP